MGFDVGELKVMPRAVCLAPMSAGVAMCAAVHVQTQITLMCVQRVGCPHPVFDLQIDRGLVRNVYVCAVFRTLAGVLVEQASARTLNTANMVTVQSETAADASATDHSDSTAQSQTGEVSCDPKL